MNEGTVELDNDQLQKMPHMVFSARNRPKSNDFTNMSNCYKTNHIPNTTKGYSALNMKSRNNIGKRKSTADAMLQKIESIKNSLSSRLQSQPSANPKKTQNSISKKANTKTKKIEEKHEIKKESPKIVYSPKKHNDNFKMYINQQSDSQSSDKIDPRSRKMPSANEKWKNERVESKLREKLKKAAGDNKNHRKNPLSRCKSQDALHSRRNITQNETTERNINEKSKKIKDLEENRIARLGLNFVYMQTDRRRQIKGLNSCKSESNIKSISKQNCIDKTRNRNPENKVKIQSYMKRKKELENRHKKKLEFEQTQKRERIQSNQSKLNEMIHRIFSSSKSKKPSKSHKKNPAKSKELFNLPEDSQGAKCDSPILSKIKSQLVKEMENSKPKTAPQKPIKKQNKLKSVVKIQSLIRSYLARKRVAELKTVKFMKDLKTHSSLENFNAVDDIYSGSQKKNLPNEKHDSPNIQIQNTESSKKISSEISNKNNNQKNTANSICPIIADLSILPKNSVISEKIQNNVESENTPLKSNPTEEEKDMKLLEKHSLFNRNPFHMFSLRKYGEHIQSDSLSELLKAREKAIIYREKNEKRIITQLFKKKKISQASYQSKRKELEKWVTAEKAEILRTKSQVMDNWKKTMEMIEDAEKGAIQIKKILMQHAVSFTNSINSSTNSIGQSQLKNNNQTYEENAVSLENVNNEQTKKLTNNLLLAKYRNSDEFAEMNRKDSDQAIFIQENISSPPSTAKHVTPQPISPTVEKEFCVPSEPRNAIVILDQVQPRSFSREIIGKNKEFATLISNEILHKITCQTIDEVLSEVKLSVDSKKELSEELTSVIYANLLNECLSSLYPSRESTNNNAQNQLQNVQQKSIAPPLSQSQSKYTTLALACKKLPGADLYRINDYVDEVFLELFIDHRNQFMEELNRPVGTDAKEVLSKLQNPEQGIPWQIMQQLPHEISPIISLDVYLEVEKKKEISKPESDQIANSKNSLSESQQVAVESDHIYNKAIFDSVNEALNLIRPYGLTGEPVPWSGVQRLLYTKIGDPNIVVRNVKNIVFSRGAND